MYVTLRSDLFFEWTRPNSVPPLTKGTLTPLLRLSHTFISISTSSFLDGVFCSRFMDRTPLYITITITHDNFYCMTFVNAFCTSIHTCVSSEGLFLDVFNDASFCVPDQSAVCVPPRVFSNVPVKKVESRAYTSSNL